MIKIFISPIITDKQAKEYEKGVNAFLKKHKIIKGINNLVYKEVLYTIIWYQK